MSGDGKRSVAEWPKLPRPSSTLPFRTSRDVRLESELRAKADIIDHAEFADPRPGPLTTCVSCSGLRLGDLPVVSICRNPTSLISTPNHKHFPAVPPHQEGRFAIVMNVEAGCGGRGSSALDERGFRGRRSRVVLMPRRWHQAREVMILRATVARKPGHRGEYEGNR